MSYLDPSNCPPDETIACLLDGRLDEDSRNAVLEHAADCPSCRFVLAEAARTSSARLAGSAPRVPYRALALAASLAVVAGAAWWGLMARGPSLEDVFIHLMRDLGAAARPAAARAH